MPLNMYGKQCKEKCFVMCVEAILGSIKAKRQREILHILTTAFCCSSEE